MKRTITIPAFLMLTLLIGSLTIGCSGSGDYTESNSTTNQSESTEQSKPAMTQTLCPIMENDIDKKIFADHKGKRVYFCCPPCIDKFNSDPDTYIDKLEAAGVVLDTTPEAG